ncbi:MAG TPA: hypothetical protein VMM18_03385 [Gemmatimonadaceae bacterium]|nr:hypothetical protein [Gemmatimonadaceae bacterium]
MVRRAFPDTTRLAAARSMARPGPSRAPAVDPTLLVALPVILAGLRLLRRKWLPEPGGA